MAFKNSLHLKEEALVVAGGRASGHITYKASSLRAHLSRAHLPPFLHLLRDLSGSVPRPPSWGDSHLFVPCDLRGLAEVTEVCRVDLTVQVPFGTGIRDAVVAHNPLHPVKAQQGLALGVVPWWTVVTAGSHCPFRGLSSGAGPCRPGLGRISLARMTDLGMGI